MKNEKGISLIALIITIIVIIILAAIVIGSVLNAPDQANFAKYCQDYSEIQSAVSTQAAVIYGELATTGATKLKAGSPLSIQGVYRYLCTAGATKTSYNAAAGTVELTAAPTGTELVPLAVDDNDNLLGLSSIPDYVTWYVDVNTGNLYSSAFNYEGTDYYSSTLKAGDLPTGVTAEALKKQ